MKVSLTESDLRGIVKNVIKEAFNDPELRKQIKANGGLDDNRVDARYNRNNQAFPLDQAEYGAVIPADLVEKIMDSSRSLWFAMVPYLLKTKNGDYIVLRSKDDTMSDEALNKITNDKLTGLEADEVMAGKYVNSPERIRNVKRNIRKSYDMPKTGIHKEKEDDSIPF